MGSEWKTIQGAFPSLPPQPWKVDTFLTPQLTDEETEAQRPINCPRP